ncbi:heme-thiolate peroxidase aromatic peroxygenase [Dacryopinax primogenitus]|uniref:Heme-thiolate peroxidase aromatic peroxygenase n=1 Tax=Dacryopinax primogenitus (strain DJM 731) TaxID=1858805 RepID=M5G2E8_DACPD|nr:heme-thiolate peroxidase aromatic peroxygenase [Dacryopinax primogenitus]EJU02390.1 heme-thiolate peroxidase aromatic peroxygenase [Dacryopinax primogenitus]
MLLSALCLLLASSPISVDAFPAYAKRYAGPRGDNAGKYPILRRAAAPYSPEFPYTGATLNGQAGTGVGGVQVPAPGDYAHYYEDPLPGAQRGPCPGLNTLANHGFLSRDGITTYTEMVAALQNVYNVCLEQAEFPVAVALTVLGFALTDGDPVSEMISIGASVPLQTGNYGEYTGEYGGVDEHGTFELDVSLTRNDYYLNGDSHSFNGTLFGMMYLILRSSLFDFNAMALYRSQQYDRARVENPWLYFPQLALHNYGAATFLYNAFPSSAKNYTPDLETISSFFGAVQLPNGEWSHVGERTPPDWQNRVTPLNLTEVSTGLSELYAAYPKEYGANVSGVWYPLNTTATAARKRQSESGVLCGAYDEIIQHAGECFNHECGSLFVNSITETAPHPLAMLQFVVEKANPVFEAVGCQVYTF